MKTTTIPVTPRTPRPDLSFLEIPPITLDLPRKGESSGLHLITWRLELSGHSQGHFNRLDRQHDPGFSWMIAAPIQGIFSPPVLHDGALLMIDALDNEEKIGTFYYRICATIDGKLYRSSFHLPFPPVPPPNVDHRRTAGEPELLAAPMPLAAPAPAPAPSPMHPYTTSNPLIKNR